MSPDFLLADVDRLATELRDAAAAGLRTAIDAMPADCGRNPAKLAELSRRTGVQHRRRDRAPPRALLRAVALEPARLGGLSSPTCSSPTSSRASTNATTAGRSCSRTDIRAGIVKVAGSEGGPSARDLPIFRAAAATHVRTGVPVHTHCEAGTGALEQIRRPRRRRRAGRAHLAQPRRQGRRSRLSPRPVRDRRLRGLRPGVPLGRPPTTARSRLLEWAVADGHAGQVMLGMDAARQGYYRAFGGSPGLAYLLREFSDCDGGARPRTPRSDAQLFVDNPARAFAFAEVDR